MSYTGLGTYYARDMNGNNDMNSYYKAHQMNNGYDYPLNGSSKPHQPAASDVSRYPEMEKFVHPGMQRAHSSGVVNVTQDKNFPNSPYVYFSR